VSLLDVYRLSSIEQFRNIFLSSAIHQYKTITLFEGRERKGETMEMKGKTGRREGRNVRGAEKNRTGEKQE
jgi:hypothetical protein